MTKLERAIRRVLGSYIDTQATEEEYEWLVEKLVDAYECEGSFNHMSLQDIIDALDIGDMCDAGSQRMIDIYAKLKNEYEEDDEDEALDEALTPEKEAYNKALDLAKKINKPVVYGYTKRGKFYEISPKAYHGDDKAFRAQYGANVAYIAYPDKNFIKENLDEDYDHVEIDQDLLDMLSNDNIYNLDEEFNSKKQRCIDMYNAREDWDNKAVTSVSCLCNVDEDVLKEWLNEDIKR